MLEGWLVFCLGPKALDKIEGFCRFFSLLTVSASSPINNKTNRMIVYRFMDINRQFTGHSEEQDREIVFDKLIMLYMLNGQ